MLGLDAKSLLNLEEAFDRVDHVEDGDICTGFRQTFGECKTTASCTTSYKRCAAFQGELGVV